MSATLKEIITMSKFPDSAADEGVPLRPSRRAMGFLSRREVIAAAAAGGALVAAGSAHAQTFGNPDEPPQGAINSSPGALSDPGPRNPTLQSQFPDAVSPPATDVGDMPQFWGSFNNSQRRIQSGGWAREVTQADFPISTAVSGVNMRLGPGGIRELHWHQSAEWAYMTNGHCRITVLDTEGRAYVQDVSEGDLWYFPAGQPHSLQGIGPHGCEFLIVFDDGKASEFNTLLVTDWIAHTPPEVLALNFGVPAETFKSIPLHDLWIFQGKEPGPLAAAQSVHLLARGRDTRLQQFERHRARRRQQDLQSLDHHRGGAGDDQAGRHPRDALAPERRRMAILDKRPRPHDRVQHGTESGDEGFPRRRPRGGQEGFRSLHPEHRDNGRAALGGIQDLRVPGGLAFRLADAHAARARGTTSQHRRVGPAAVPEQTPGIHAGLTNVASQSRGV
jgi:oxalate decarboxylase/phosphoglucose isomerase-like protein (cupin superfamily)